MRPSLHVKMRKKKEGQYYEVQVSCREFVTESFASALQLLATQNETKRLLEDEERESRSVIRRPALPTRERYATAPSEKATRLWPLQGMYFRPYELFLWHTNQKEKIFSNSERIGIVVGNRNVRARAGSSEDKVALGRAACGYQWVARVVADAASYSLNATTPRPLPVRFHLALAL
jgi:hypothetical protein